MLTRYGAQRMIKSDASATALFSSKKTRAMSSLRRALLTNIPFESDMSSRGRLYRLLKQLFFAVFKEEIELKCHLLDRKLPPELVEHIMKYATRNDLFEMQWLKYWKNTAIGHQVTRLVNSKSGEWFYLTEHDISRFRQLFQHTIHIDPQ